MLPKDSGDEEILKINPPSISKKPEYEVKKDTIETVVRASGKIMAMKEEDLFFTQENKRVKEVYVNPGDTVKKGQLLAELDVSDLESQLRMKLLENRQSELSMKETLRSDDKTAEQMEQAKISFEIQRQQLAELQATIGKAKLTAPFNGTIAAVYVQKGDNLKAYDAALVIADLSKLTVAVNVTAEDIKKVTPGMETVVEASGFGKLKGKVRQLPNPKSTSGNGGGNPGGGTKESLSNYLLIDLDEMPANAERGTPVSASIVVQRKTDVIVIPPSALRSVGGRTYVQVVDNNGSKREVDVEVGMQTSTQIEILKGLTVGQKVVGR